MADPVDLHFELVGRQRSVERLRGTIAALDAAGVHYVVEGGWAVAAYGSVVPSVDLDVLIAGGLTPEIAGAIEAATGLQMFAQAAHDELAVEIVDMNHANPLIDQPEISYRPAEFLNGHTQRRTIPAIDDQRVRVPNPPQLAFMKLKAFHDRRIQWQAAAGQRHLLAGMPEEERTRTITRGQDFWLRKAGKDLFDASYLCHGYTNLDEISRVAPAAMWPRVRAALDGVPLPLRSFAEGMARRAGLGDVPLLARR